MSAEILKNAVKRRIAEARDQHIRALRNCKYMPAVVHKEGAVIPAAGVESIALFANQTNAWIEALEGIDAILEQEHRKLTAPEAKPTTKKKTKEMY